MQFWRNFWLFWSKNWLFLAKNGKLLFLFLQFSDRRERKSRKILMGVNSGDFSSTFSENLKWFGQVRKKLIFWCLGVAGDVNVWIRCISSQWWVRKSYQVNWIAFYLYFFKKLIAKKDSAILTKFLAFLVKKLAFFGQKWQTTFFVFAIFR